MVRSRLEWSRAMEMQLQAASAHVTPRAVARTTGQHSQTAFGAEEGTYMTSPAITDMVWLRVGMSVRVLDVPVAFPGRAREGRPCDTTQDVGRQAPPVQVPPPSRRGPRIVRARGDVR